MRFLKGVETRLRRWRNRAAPVLLAGGAMHCPVCTRSFRRFRAAGRRPERRANAVCPFCASRERDRLAFLFLRDVAAGGPILHIAPEACLAPRLRQLAQGGYLCADLLRKDVDARFDVMAIPHPDGAFQGIYCSHVLQDVQDDLAALAELFRILKPGGWAIVNVPVKTTRTVDHPDAPLNPRSAADPRPAEHLRTYGADFAERMAAVGFDVRVAGADELAEAEERARLGIGVAAGSIYCGIKGAVAPCAGATPTSRTEESSGR